MPFAFAPCGWEPLPCGALPATGAPGSAEEAEYVSLRDAAAGVLWALSGRQFGGCEVVYRPCRAECVQPLPSWPLATLDGGTWVNASCRACGDRCSCSAISEVRLPGVVYEVVEVKLDGVALDDAAYRVDDGNWLVRVDGGSWPTCQEMALPPTEVGTWSATVLDAVPLPVGGRRALGELMSEMWKSCGGGGGGSCLPKRVQTITRQGLTIGLLDPMEFLDKGRTGLYFTDLWLRAVNPESRPQGARVLSLDMERHRTTTWP